LTQAKPKSHPRGRAKNRNGLALVAPIYPKIYLIRGYNDMLRMELAHADNAEIGQVRLPVPVPPAKFCKFCQVFSDIKLYPKEILGYQSDMRMTSSGTPLPPKRPRMLGGVR